ncbi:uncharacterized protein BDR25DRAFT_347897 [Lindgomyces ingoldianus]|uniref:Uncharacterized protein n=1 Tax=Lindgomyces ingoldianus TaxID=673940 RepID=A0ACB6RGU5_9PLEO|nr:uncharacterized protein BDR25DRAFT_347897 [Lindgomyces ingoldianus]KAF2477560.1 hypothetical protein BDR25DRAFT_347897 [Lindgomyces ingoldianus]
MARWMAFEIHTCLLTINAYHGPFSFLHLDFHVRTSMSHNILAPTKLALLAHDQHVSDFPPSSSRLTKLPLCISILFSPFDPNPNDVMSCNFHYGGAFETIMFSSSALGLAKGAGVGSSLNEPWKFNLPECQHEAVSRDPALAPMDKVAGYKTAQRFASCYEAQEQTEQIVFTPSEHSLISSPSSIPEGKSWYLRCLVYTT